jgi:hypothetical protein
MYTEKEALTLDESGDEGFDVSQRISTHRKKGRSEGSIRWKTDEKLTDDGLLIKFG